MSRQFDQKTINLTYGRLTGANEEWTIWEKITFDASDIVADVLVESIGTGLLQIEVHEMFLKDFIGGLVRFAQVLKELEMKERKEKWEKKTTRKEEKWEHKMNSAKIFIKETWLGFFPSTGSQNKYY